MIQIFRQFILGQSSLQLLQAINGLVLVWWLSIPDFAVYAVFAGAMGFASMMIGFGLNPTLTSCVGSRFAEPLVVGRYLRAALNLRLWTLALVSPIGIGILWYSGNKTGAPTVELGLLAVCLMAANFLSAQSDLYQSPLQMNRQIGRIFRWTVGAELVRLPLFGIAYAIGHLDSLTAGLITVGGLTMNFYGVRREGRKLIEMPEGPCEDEWRELLHLTIPTLPNVIFGALQGQIVIFIAAIFGSTGQIAAVGALGRLARLLTFLNAANGMILGPGVARLDPAAFWKRVPTIFGFTFFLSSVIASTGFLFPDSLVLVLGSNYEELSAIVWLVTLNAGLTFMTSVVGTLRSFRRWIAWWASFATIGGVLLAQAVVISQAQLDTLVGVLLLGTAGTTGRLVMLLLTMAIARFRPQWLRSTKSTPVAASVQA